MPNLPFFTLAPPISPTQPSSGSVENAHKPLNSQPLIGNNPVETGDSENATENSFLSFYQTLNEQLEEAVLPVGQELAAYAQEEPLPAELGDTQAPQLETAKVEMTGSKQEESPDWLVQSSMGVDDIQQQRSAQIKLQGNNEPQKQNTQQLKWQGEQFNQEEVQLKDSHEQNNKIASVLQTQVTSTNTLAEPLQTEGATVAVSNLVQQNSKALSSDENLLMDDTASLLEEELDLQNIHEKPLTLTHKNTSPAPLSPVIPTPLAQASAAQNVVPELTEALVQANNISTPKDPLSSSLEAKINTGPDSVLAPQEKLKLDMPPNSIQWSEQISKRITIMNSEGLQSARIQLDPPELGALEIKVKVTHDQVSVGFTSSQPAVREALEAQAPKLREMMEQEGINLADVNVSDQGQQGSGGQSADEQMLENGAGINADLEIESPQVTVSQSDSLVDYFA